MTRVRPYLIGLTGSIGMGKSTTAAMFRDAGIPVWDADAAVERLYATGGSAVGPMSRVFPQAIQDGQVSKEKLRNMLAETPDLLPEIEKIVHPLVQADRQQFIDAADAPIVALDIPLLFETGSEGAFDLVVVVSTSPAEQRKRVLARPGMTPERFAFLLSKQVPDAEKRERAGFVIDTSNLESARQGVDTVISIAKEHLSHA